jgi:hypothetical protein
LDVRLAWFSPLPPSASGIAAYSAEILPLIAARGFEIDTYTALNAHEFVWRHRRTPYDLTIYQLGNATCHDYMWAYLFRYPGLVVLHDLQLHQARALHLTKRWQPRLDDYIAEVRANHPGAPADLPYLVLARMADRMYQHWPLTRLVIERSRTTAVHNQWVAEDLRAKHPDATIRWFEMGVAASTGRSGGKSTSIRNVRATLGIPPDAFVIIALGGVTPEKRVPQLLRAVSAISSRHRNVHLLFVGAPASHYDVREDAETSGLADRIHIAGFVADTALPAFYVRACAGPRTAKRRPPGCDALPPDARRSSPNSRISARFPRSILEGGGCSTRAAMDGSRWRSALTYWTKSTRCNLRSNGSQPIPRCASESVVPDWSGGALTTSSRRWPRRTRRHCTRPRGPRSRARRYRPT